MYIQQECLFSFEEILKFQPKSKLEMILAELDFDNLISELSKSHTSCGPKGYSIRAMLNAFIAMQVERIPTLTDLSEKLKTNPILRYSCGFNVLEKTPSTPTISRFLQKISCNNALERVLNTKYYLMDSGYDQNKNYEYIVNTAKATAIIAYNKRGQYDPPEGVNENFEPMIFISLLGKGRRLFKI